MIEPRTDQRHVTDPEIDAYWTSTLSPDEEARIEQHYLDCRECYERVHVVEALVEARQAAAALPAASNARSLRIWQATAAGLAAIALFTGWQWASLVRSTQSAERAPAPATGATTGQRPAGLGTVTLALAPATRDARAAILQIPDQTSLVVVEIDVREVAPPGTRVDVTLVAPNGDRVLSARRLATTAAGAVRVPLESSLLDRGQFMFEVSAGSSTITVPLLIQPPGAR